MMRFFTKVEPRDATSELAVLSLVGPATADLFPELDAPRVTPVPGPQFANGAVPAHATSVYAVREYEGGLARRVPLGVDLLIPRERKTAVIEKLGVPLAGLRAYEAIRVGRKIPRLGWETDHRTIPAEAELIAPAVHLDKGCYRGQETVARVHHLGRPPRRLVLLHLDGIATDLPPVKGTPVLLGEGGREVGFVGTAVQHHELGLIALAVVKRNVDDDAELRVGESVAAVDAD
jgi:folate-binding protein YgfZ